MFTARQVAFLQALQTQRPASKPAKTEAMYFYEEHGLGHISRSKLEYTNEHFQRAQDLLLAYKLPLLSLPSGATRVEAARYTGLSEKSRTRAPSSDAVALHAFGGCQFQGAEIDLPPGAYLTLTVAQAANITADVILVVENKETFRYLNECSWIDRSGQRTLVVFRGDGETSAGDVVKLLNVRTEPVWAFMDYDPAGLGMAARFPRLEKLLLPEASWLKAAAAGPRGEELFWNSFEQYQATLDSSVIPAVRQAWKSLSAARCGVSQEKMADWPNII